MEFPIQYQVPKMATRMKINVNVVLDERAIINVCLYDDDNEYIPIFTKMIVLEGDAYKNWGQDDNYIKDIVFEALGMKTKEPEPQNILEP